MPVRKRSVTIAGHRTSYSVEDDFFALLKRAADEDGSGEIDKKEFRRAIKAMGFDFFANDELIGTDVSAAWSLI